MEAAAPAPEPPPPPTAAPPSHYDGIRSIFYYNTEVRSGQSVGLHLFEPRYRVMIQRAMEDPARERQLLFLPNFKEYIAASGDVGVIARVRRHVPIPDGASLPRAEVELEFGEPAVVLWHWVEPGTSGLHECTFRRLARLPAPHALEPLRDALHTSSVGRYRVHTQRGFLNIHETPASPDATDNIRGRLMQDEVITALEHRPGWVRHDKGWSVSRVRGDSWLWLVPEHPQEIAAGVQMIEGSDNTLSPSLLMHSPSAEASAAARAAFEAVAPGSSEHVIEIRIRAAAELVAVDEVLERLAALYDRDAVVPPPASAGKSGLQAKVAEIVSPDKEEQLRVAAAADAAADLLRGVDVLVASGVPCHLSISEVSYARRRPNWFATASGSPLPLAQKVSDTAAFGSSAEPFEHFNSIGLDSYIRSQYTWESDVLPLCPWVSDAPPTGCVVAHCCSLTVCATDDAATAVIPPNFALISKGDAQRCVGRLLRRVNWHRIRLLFIGQREGDCVFALLDAEALRAVIEELFFES